MKLFRVLTPLAFLCAAISGQAQLTIPGADGSDGVLNITTNTVINLSRAIITNWYSDNAANPGAGVYDSNQWAVVFKYSSVNVSTGATLTFLNHPSRAPLVWLVSGNVTINGSVVLDGQDAVVAPGLSEPGPGGFRGGNGYYSAGVGSASGFGPGGGGNSGDYNGPFGYGGSYGTTGCGGPAAYGNPSLIPLIGGSGGGGGYTSGGAGGGAILISCADTLTVSGLISANGGFTGSSVGGNGFAGSGDGSGGGIRLVALSLVGNGEILALGGDDALYGGLGRIRIENVVSSNSITVIPDPSVVALNAGSTALIWPPTNAPTVTIVSIGTAYAPADPRAGFGTIGADVVQPLTNSIPVVIETTNVEQASQVFVLGTPRSNGSSTQVPASVSSVVSTNPLTLFWTANLPVNVGYSAVQVQVIRP